MAYLLSGMQFALSALCSLFSLLGLGTLFQYLLLQITMDKFYGDFMPIGYLQVATIALASFFPLYLTSNMHRQRVKGVILIGPVNDEPGVL